MTTHPETPSESFARRVKRYRGRRGWTQEDFAAELTAIGWTVDRFQVAKIEAHSRKVSLDEMVALAWVLGLPPALLYLPLGEGDVKIENNVIETDAARRWVTGQAPAMDSEQYVRLPGEWKADMVIWWLHDQFHNAWESIKSSESAVQAAEYVGDPERIEQAKLGYVSALQHFAAAGEEILNHRLHPPAIHEKTAEAMRLVGIKYKGPVYKPEEAEA